MWATRAETEIKAAFRTWFGTLTLRPAAQCTMLSRAITHAGDDFDNLSDRERFIAVCRQIGPELAKYLKSIRRGELPPHEVAAYLRENGRDWDAWETKFRFMCVFENHNSGLPHMHMLLHEQNSDARVRHRLLCAHWLWGFTNWRLVKDMSEASYLPQYLNKSPAARVRASCEYGIEKIFF